MIFYRGVLRLSPTAPGLKNLRNQAPKNSYLCPGKNELQSMQTIIFLKKGSRDSFVKVLASKGFPSVHNAA